MFFLLFVCPPPPSLSLSLSVPQITDFGVSEWFSDDEGSDSSPNAGAGSPAFMAPETCESPLLTTQSVRVHVAFVISMPKLTWSID